MYELVGTRRAASSHHGSRFVTLLVMLFCLSFQAKAEYAIADIPNVHLSDSTLYVSDPEGILSAEALGALDGKLGSIWRTASAEPVVVVIDRADTDDLDTYATELFESWGIGKKDKDNGLLILISRDQRRAVIRTGQGVEGLIPDAIASRIIRNVMAPRMAQEDYDGGTIAAVDAVSEILTDPEARDELMSKYPNNADARHDDDLTLGQFFKGYFIFGMVITVILLIVYIYMLASTRRDSAHMRYDKIMQLRMPALMLAIFGCGLPLILWWIITVKLRRIRLRPRLCPNGHGKMQRLDEVTDNQYLTAPQNTEEELNSVDYDVWLCPVCQDTIVEPYVNRSSQYVECDLCHTRSARLVGNQVLRKPSVTTEGIGAKIFHCNHCRNNFNHTYPIAKLPPVVVLPGGGGRGGFGGGGGFSGGSFGGGSTMGGGASGGW